MDWALKLSAGESLQRFARGPFLCRSEIGTALGDASQGLTLLGHKRSLYKVVGRKHRSVLGALLARCRFATTRRKSINVTYLSSSTKSCSQQLVACRVKPGVVALILSIVTIVWTAGMRKNVF